MFRFFAITWNVGDHEQQATARLLAARLASNSPDWNKAWEADGFVTFCADARPNANEAYPIASDQGVVMGKLFRRDGNAGDVSTIELSANDGTRAVDTVGKHIIDRYYGRYVAFWRDRSGRRYVLRDPTGTLPCYESTFRGVHLYFSWLPDCLGLGLPNFTINWDYITALVAMVIIHCRETGLNEVRQLLQGERVEWDGNRRRSVLMWDPYEFAQDMDQRNAEDLATSLRGSVRQVVHAWASCYSGILHRMSGGLDSTIVLSCLKDAPTRPQVTGLIHFSTNGGNDERPFATLAAQSANIPLVECERNFGVALEPALQMHPSAEPHSCLPFLQNDGIESRVALARGASAIFSGGGGDQLFLQGSSRFTATDYIWKMGIRPSLLRVAHSAARLERVSIWDILRSGFADARARRRWQPLNEIGRIWRLTVPDSIKEVLASERFLHPWQKAPMDAPIGKQRQIYSLHAPHTYYDPRGSAVDPEWVSPLASQPLIETILRIPSWILTSDGWDRALARRAFSSDMPAKIVTRRSKGVGDPQADHALHNNIEFVRAVLLDGFLVNRRLIDREKLQTVLAGSSTCVDSPLVELYHYLSLEAWLQRSSSASLAVAA